MRVLKEHWGNSLAIEENILRPGPKPKFSDLEVVVLNLTAECLSIDSENLLFNKLNANYKESFPHLISRRQYNDRRKNLFKYIENVRQTLTNEFNAINEVYAVDSMPLELCKLSRMSRNKMAADGQYFAPDKGYCASQSKYYFGYKLHAVCNPSGVIHVVDLTKASVHDIHFLKDISNILQNCLITGDRGYINSKLKTELFEKSAICLETPLRSNQRDKTKLIYQLRKIRKRIETVFSQLCDQFMIQRNYAKSFYGYRTRILSKITGLTLLQYINKINGKPIGQVKYALK
ncbi:IS982 family transposase [Mucilaginibacter litoreus]|uniref:IS982 family transposase n=2 Tax=Mucilaginibacter litoreus TaxID=1048221 RepID=A0ABW3AQ97_9SPHI